MNSKYHNDVVPPCFWIKYALPTLFPRIIFHSTLTIEC